MQVIVVKKVNGSEGLTMLRINNFKQKYIYIYKYKIIDLPPQSITWTTVPQANATESAKKQNKTFMIMCFLKICEDKTKI